MCCDSCPAAASRLRLWLYWSKVSSPFSGAVGRGWAIFSYAVFFFVCFLFYFVFLFFFKLNSVNELQLNPNMYESIFKHKNIFWLSASRLFDLRLWDLDSLVEKCPGYTLVAGRRREGAVVAVVVPQILRQQRPDVKRRDVDLLICQRVWQRERETKKNIQVLNAQVTESSTESSSPEKTWTDLTCVSDPAQVVEDVVERWVGLLTCLGN